MLDYHRLPLIGSTDVAAILGVHPYKTAGDVYLRLTEGIRTPVGPAAYWGTELEPVVAARWAAGNGLKVKLSKPLVMPHGREWQKLDTDYLVEGRPALLEIKTTNANNAKRWGVQGTDQIPVEYLVQVHCALEAYGLDVGHVAVLIGGQDYREYIVHRDEEINEAIVSECGRFWRDHVLPRSMPAIEPGPTANAWLDAKTHRKDMREATDQEVGLIKRIAKHRQGVKDLIESKEKLELELKALIGPGSTVSGGGFKASLTRSKPADGVNWEALARELGADRPEFSKLVEKHQGPMRRPVTTLRIGEWNR